MILAFLPALNLQKQHFYLGTGLPVGNFTGADSKFNYASQKKWSAQFGIKYVSSEAENKPLDYSGGFFSAITLSLCNQKDETPRCARLIISYFKSSRICNPPLCEICNLVPQIK